MYDRSKILTGIVLFLVVVLFPVWYSVAFGKAKDKPNPEPETRDAACVEPVDYMRAHHMQLLDTWRNSFVREGKTTWTGPDGRRFDISLEKTCLSPKCHTRAHTCDECHNYADVVPYCWNCHLDAPRREAGR